MDVLSRQEQYVSLLEQLGHSVHYPARDTNQHDIGINICRQNMNAIKQSDEVHVFYSPDSQGTHFDMGMAFAMGKKVVAVNTGRELPNGKSFERMLIEWAEESKHD